MKRVRKSFNHEGHEEHEGKGEWNCNHEIHGMHERGEAPESAASAVDFLSASGWAWVGLGKPRILGKKKISRRDAKPPRGEGEKYEG